MERRAHGVPEEYEGIQNPCRVHGHTESLEKRAHGVPEEYEGTPIPRRLQGRTNPWKSRRAESLRRLSTRANEVPGEYVGILNPKRANVESKRVNGDPKRVQIKQRPFQ